MITGMNMSAMPRAPDAKSIPRGRRICDHSASRGMQGTEP